MSKNVTNHKLFSIRSGTARKMTPKPQIVTIKAIYNPSIPKRIRTVSCKKQKGKLTNYLQYETFTDTKLSVSSSLK
jgi:hypothetical protein